MITVDSTGGAGVYRGISKLERLVARRRCDVRDVWTRGLGERSWSLVFSYVMPHLSFGAISWSRCCY